MQSMQPRPSSSTHRWLGSTTLRSPRRHLHSHTNPLLLSTVTVCSSALKASIGAYALELKLEHIAIRLQPGAQKQGLWPIPKSEGPWDECTCCHLS
jgi:hypothetical protein